ncbi:uncharacterized protein LOC126718817 isoform X2 [Quercus robur]|uniref:uncharacterized protein LOC126718817 isoform X2 n=1 Tax=Quercus robur TaxID=38942 RepID=UPI002163E6BB|nr:uncharacterized protein LOC126718817 isoform X2 [Quercus robur]
MASLNNEGASFSSSTRQWEYDVFLSFRGEDTREGFTSHLYKALCNKGINTFIDDIDLPRGEEISKKLIQAIKNSSILVIVFSENYAESKWCLDELAEIVECIEKDQEVQIRPIFFNVDPSEIRNQNGNFGITVANHEKKFKNNKDKDKVQRWRDALKKAANASGWHYKKGEVVRQQKPDILGKRSRLWSYKDSLEVLTRNKVSEKNRSIMLHSPNPVNLQLHSKAFKKIENLKFLSVENVNIYEPLEFLPHSLKVFKWSNYPFPGLSEYFPEQLVAIEMPHNCIRLPKLITQELRIENLIHVNLSDCEFITELPKLWAPNLESLKLDGCKNLVKLTELGAQNLKFLNHFYCENLVEIDECFGSLEKLTYWGLSGCSKLQILPSQLRLKSLRSFYLSGCTSLEKFPNFHPEMECLQYLSLDESGIREVPSSIEHLTKLERLSLYKCKNLGDLPDSIYKLQQLRYLQTHTAKLRPTCDSFDGSSGYGFVNMTKLNLRGCEGIIELDLLMKPNYFPALTEIDLSYTNIVTIPESISRFPRLIELFAEDCKLLHEIQGLPQSIRRVYVYGSMLLNTSPSGLFNQVIGIIGILPNRVCGRARSNKLMDLQFSNNLPSETKATEWVEFWGESFDGFDRDIAFSGTEMLKWFNHQSVDNSISFFVGRNFPKLVVCIVPGPERFHGFVEISINGYENREYQSIRLPGSTQFPCSQYLFSLTQWSLLQRHLNESNPTDQNLVKVSIRYESDDTCYSIKMWGVHVECTCPPQEDDAVDYGYSIKFSSQEYDLKRLLLYCSLFPLGYEFGKEEMVQLWIAEEFIKERQRMEVAGCEYFDYLVEVEFIQDSRYDYSVDFYSFLSDEFDSNGGKKLYKVNEAQASLLKMAISEGSYQSELGDKLDVASEFDSNGGKKLFKVNEAQASLLKMAISEGGYRSEFGDKLDVASELTRHLSLPCESINDQMAIETLKRCTNLRTLLLLSGCGYNVKQVPRDLFLSLKLLRTLNLRRTLISELPSSIGNVKSLRYLDVSNTHIRRLPESIDCLSNLQTLKLKGCLDFVALPKNMKKLTNLRHLELDIVRQLISMPKRIGNLTNLQTLSAFLVGRDDECGIEELKNMTDLCGTFCISRLERVSSLDKAKEAALIDKMYLDKLELRWSDIRVVNPEEEEEILESLQPHSGLREIQILFYGGIKIPSWICNPSFADLVSITLYKCRNCEFLPSLGDLPSLKFLFIREMNEVKKIDHQFCRNGSDKGFAKLEKLEINVMLNLEEWMGVENGDLPVLRKLTVEYFPKLIALPSLSCLISLEHLEIKHCSRLQCLPNEGLPTSLEFLLIKGCPELKERCCKEEGLDWGKIEHVPNIWIDHQEISSS